MKVINICVVSISAFILAGCTNDGRGFGSWGPTVVTGNQNFVTVKDAIGLPNGRLDKATEYCGQYGKSAAYQSEGGDSFECSGTTWCATYQCK